ncbi:tRNA (N6-threonylcarbamoyladenosine(37)-N6)-methyltransferase TrmO [Larsenimonas suaedae]|uniref:tRNA (N6-threonylcarbamoyladenosine(37)-N6)-methyltransferase TrmO n=1 Tax=Larsenimonas suaedae TaxID=1851019 RepID=A0ABU1GTX9_9GAMM|nr:tRNA (N6-threonylcarbamoyladenosine(37)-N6)-methyltransferase TrmO [Larsenimonas suaedae]MCM2971889.1 tRNA (N6-threonylcarbamoyladenosine(37)-N6)-methyltransferase TrmO [Larsenimonas suaedae]MDR5895441.1 tRNA (N6-threonylcarbamoyladenosine(37)-N6)-methyltransferase TrmO [Larsenimonas suaedae]
MHATHSTTLEPIGHIESCYPDKFGIPRQPGLAPSAKAQLVLHAPYNDPLAVRGLDAFSHIWVTFLFHKSPPSWTPLVRPPRLGGNAKVGVFATRATHRPNRLGLSLVELVSIDTEGGVALTLSGHDLVDGTPVFDIKPYLPWADGVEGARSGFAPAPPVIRPVCFSQTARTQLNALSDGAAIKALIVEVLAQDPRPAYQHGSTGRVHGVRLSDKDVRFRAFVDDTDRIALEVIEITSGDPT